MVNAWSLLDSVLNGTLDEDYPIMSKDDDVTIFGGESADTITFTGMSSAIGAGDTINLGSPIFGSASPDTIDFGTPLRGGMGEDHIVINSGYAGTAYDDPNYYVEGYDPYPTLSGVDPVYAHHFPGEDTKPKPDLKYKSQKYQEDKGIKDLKDYVSSTYQGHYTNENSDVQTLDLIHSVGDAESFCRSNALKYLSRYDKKGTAKRDILKAMHYCLLLYYFSGNTNDETPTRGYETF